VGAYGLTSLEFFLSGAGFILAESLIPVFKSLGVWRCLYEAWLMLIAVKFPHNPVCLAGQLLLMALANIAGRR
jgi:hypothetical protein